MVLKCLILAMTLSLTVGWVCGGTRDNIQIGPPHRRMLTTRDLTNWSPIRLYFSYDPAFNLGSSALNTYFKTVGIVAANNFL